MTEVAPIITALALLATAGAGAYVAVQQTRTKAIAKETKEEVERVHIQVNSNLTDLKNELERQNDRWDKLIARLGQHPDAARIFAELVPEKTDEPR